MLNNSAIMQQFAMMMQQGAGNPQAYVQELLRRNPQFAQQIQGQNPQTLASQYLRQMGIDPQQFFANPMQFMGQMPRR
jgi:ABC-type dipeptide/oligopeptide/nickel transport system ATPase subunit